MTANELADELEKAFMTNTSQYFAMPAVLMLRQQQAEIEQLKAENEQLFTSMLNMALDEELRNLKEG